MITTFIGFICFAIGLVIGWNSECIWTPEKFCCPPHQWDRDENGRLECRKCGGRADE